MQQPQGFVDLAHPTYVSKLHKALYGLKQAPRAWFDQLSSWLSEYGFQVSKADPSLFIFNTPAATIFLLVYVDDLVITASNSLAINTLIAATSKAFPVRDLGNLSFFLGLEIDHTTARLFISQRKYINNLLTRSNMLQCKPMSSPMAASLKLSKFGSLDFDDPVLYRSLVGGLQYLNFTWPDISFAVNKLCQFMHSPKLPHWSALKRVLRYLKGTINHGLFFTSHSGPVVQAYSDADWGGCPDDRRSTSGCCIFLGNHLISWSSKKQKSAARSSTEAKYKSLASSAAELIWLQFLLKELGIFLPQAPTLWCDNLGATYLCANPIFHSKTKHMDIDYHFVRDRVATNSLRISFCSTNNQIADILIKPLVSYKFLHFTMSLNGVDTPLDSRGRISSYNKPS
ncbi:uncharacterized mitochondrial protein AtMg00810-like [Malania oleifera]|uniref:uncharacterized mitochondrial protein AtMg00810-like n=1 Tax=Malania oleifera TaxID=397392 RepID=UPI0025AE859F|nr:uncharacterized mitochondrial protein AtMg00810-like [Malania oleifera]